jgi:hypothetical protein
MPIHDCPLTRNDGDSLVAYLPITIVNPHTGKSYRTHGIIDTGADECAIPAEVAKILGHKLRSGIKTEVIGLEGPATGWSHTTIILVHHPHTGEIIYTVPETPIDYMRGLTAVLLGVNSFLSRFVVTFDYPRNTFSVIRPFAGP